MKKLEITMKPKIGVVGVYIDDDPIRPQNAAAPNHLLVDWRRNGPRSTAGLDRDRQRLCNMLFLINLELY